MSFSLVPGQEQRPPVVVSRAPASPVPAPQPQPIKVPANISPQPTQVDGLRGGEDINAGYWKQSVAHGDHLMEIMAPKGTPEAKQSQVLEQVGGRLKG
jgi:hypothetical protein